MNSVESKIIKKNKINAGETVVYKGKKATVVYEIEPGFFSILVNSEKGKSIIRGIPLSSLTPLYKGGAM